MIYPPGGISGKMHLGRAQFYTTAFVILWYAELLAIYFLINNGANYIAIVFMRCDFTFRKTSKAILQ